MYECPNKWTQEYDVFTNAGPAAAFRAPGHPQGCFALEQSIDELAEKLGMDPLDLRDKIDVNPQRRVERRLGREKFGWAERRKANSDSGPVKRGMGVPQIRNVATIGGNLLQRPRCWYFRHAEFPCRRKGGEICFAQDGENQYHAIFDNHICAIVAPSSAAVPLIALNAQIELTSKEGKRLLALEKFYLTPEQNVTREHSLRPGELLTGVVIPAVSRGTKSAYQKYGEKDSHDWPIADAAVVLQMDGNTVRKASIVLGAALPRRCGQRRRKRY